MNLEDMENMSNWFWIILRILFRSFSKIGMVGLVMLLWGLDVWGVFETGFSLELCCRILVCLFYSWVLFQMSPRIGAEEVIL